MGVANAWGDTILWNLIPAALGNILGGSLLVILPLYYVFAERGEIVEEK